MSNTHWINVPEAIYALRRDIHRHPELAFEEHRTADLIARALESWGLTVHRGLAGTGVVGILRCGTSPKTIGLRADMSIPVEPIIFHKAISCLNGPNDDVMNRAESAADTERSSRCTRPGPEEVPSISHAFFETNRWLVSKKA